MHKFQRESASKDFFGEALPLFYKHYKEIAHYQDIPLAPDLEHYENLENLGVLRIYTAREEETNELIGYCAFIVKTNAHYKTSKQASQDVIYIDPNKRGFGEKFILWCDEQLKGEDVQAVYHHVKLAHNWGKILTRNNYQLVDLIYARRLDH